MGLIEKFKRYMKNKSPFTYLCENQRFLKDFKFWLTKENKKKTVKPYDGQFISKYGCYEGVLKMERHIVFYEWSTTTGNKRIFQKMQDFYNFLDESKIAFPDYTMRKLIEDNDMNYLTCIPGKAQLLHATSVMALEKALNAFKSQSASNSTLNNPYNYHCN